MTQERTPAPSSFDAYATDYDRALDRGISVSGEDKEYFAAGRVRWLAGRLAAMGERPRHILDFGCGTGTGARFLAETFNEATVLGVDVSAASLETARNVVAKTTRAARVQFRRTNDFRPDGAMNLVSCNGVFHHIPPAEREAAVAYVGRALRPGGLFAFWENNPWNPGTRYVMSRIPFDRDAITLTPPEARRLLRAGGLEIVRTDFLFIFPKVLGWLRGLEPRLARWPLGAQYLVLSRKP